MFCLLFSVVLQTILKVLKSQISIIIVFLCYLNASVLLLYVCVFVCVCIQGIV